MNACRAWLLPLVVLMMCSLPVARSEPATGHAPPETLTQAQRTALRTALVDLSIARTSVDRMLDPSTGAAGETRESLQAKVAALIDKTEPAAVGETAAARSLRKLLQMLQGMLDMAIAQTTGEPSPAYHGAQAAYDKENQRYMREITEMERSFILHERATEAAANRRRIEVAPGAPAIQAGREQQFLDTYRKQRGQAVVDEVIARVKAAGDALTIYVTEKWNGKDVVFRHENAQGMYITWTTIVGPARSRFANISLVGPSGKEVGGTRPNSMISIPVPQVWVEQGR